MTEVDGVLSAAVITAGEIADSLPSFITPLTYATGTTFLLTLPGTSARITATFLNENGRNTTRPTHLAIRLRALPRS